MIIKEYDFMHKDIVDIRTDVFVVEQNFKEEFDDIDNNCMFLVMYDKDKAIAMCRYFPVADDTYAIGRIAVIKEYRGQGIGAKIVKEAEARVKALGIYKTTLSAQVRAKEFYEKLGYVGEGEIYYEEYCEHIKMKKVLEDMV
ncbi:MAG: GNAT family N-acetyltransferase [Lachnospiraceae bacterium]|nr:GNAT family N-acetyltransferase [Lachnospiraceae bacterium]